MPATSASSSRSRPGGREVRGTGMLEGRSRDRAARHRGLRLRPGLRPGRRGADRRRARRRLEGAELPPRAGRTGADHRARARQSLTFRPAEPPRGQRVTPARGLMGEPGFPRVSEARHLLGQRVAPPPAPPVELGAEDDHVRHQVEPDEEDAPGRRCALQAGESLREAEVDGEHLERSPRSRLSRAIAPGSTSPERVLDVRQQVVRPRRGRRTPQRRDEHRDHVARRPSSRPRPVRAARAGPRPNEPITRPAKSRIEQAEQQRDGERLPAAERPVRPAVDDVERRLERAEQRRATTRAGRAARRCRASAEFSWIARTALDDRRDRAVREDLRQLLDEVARLVGAAERGRAARGRERVSGTNESSAKYAIIAARWVPRSAWNLRKSSRFRTRTRAVSTLVGSAPMDPAQALSRADGDLVADRGRAASSTPTATVHRLTIADEASAKRFADAATALVAAALRGSAGRRRHAARPARGRRRSTGASSSSATATRAVAAVTKPEPTVGLVFYDLKSCLRAAAHRATATASRGRRRATTERRRRRRDESAA